MKKKILLTSILIALSSLNVFASSINLTSDGILSSISADRYIEEKNDAEKIYTFNLYINGKSVTLENGFIIEDGRTFLPMRELGGLIGAEVGWDQDNKVAIMSKSIDDRYGTTYRLDCPLGNKKALLTKTYTGSSGSKIQKYYDNDNKNLEPIFCNWSTYLPLRFISENMGYTVTYFNDTREIHLTDEFHTAPKSSIGVAS